MYLIFVWTLYQDNVIVSGILPMPLAPLRVFGLQAQNIVQLKMVITRLYKQ